MLERTIDAATEPVSSDEAKLWVKQDDTADDTLIAELITAARQWCEDFTHRSFITQTWKLTLDDFPGGSDSEVWLSRGPVIAVSSITYLDQDGIEQTWSSSNYRLVTSESQARLALNLNQQWPTSIADVIGAVSITYTAGFGAASDVPAQIKTAMKQLIAHWYEHRESVVIGPGANQVPQTVENLLYSWRVPQVVC